MLVTPETDRDRDFVRLLQVISFLGELNCADGIKSCLVDEYQDKCYGLHEQATINAPHGIVYSGVFQIIR